MLCCYVVILMTSNGNWTEWNPIQSVIIQVINPFSPKSDQYEFSLYNNYQCFRKQSGHET